MTILKAENLNLYYGAFHALKNVEVSIEENLITAMIGPSGCGKSTLLRTFNRMNDLIEGVRTEGRIIVDGDNILEPKYDLVALRKKVGMVFQRPNPFPMSIEANITLGLKIHGMSRRDEFDGILHRSLDAVSLWNDLKDKLNRSALGLSLEQQQRLCIARLIAVKPEILLMDEPCSALDPIATAKIEELMLELKKNYTIIIVTHNMQQAARISDVTGFMLLGDLIDLGPTDRLFTVPRDKRTEDYISGKFG